MGTEPHRLRWNEESRDAALIKQGQATVLSFGLLVTLPRWNSSSEDHMLMGNQDLEFAKMKDER